jgi:GT2 family glycosyltransferase
MGNPVPSVTIVILNWNNAPDTLECLASVLKLTYLNFNVIVVDNGSEDGSINVIEEKFPEITYIKLSTNLGYAGGNNVGLQWALQEGTDYVMVLNNDTILDPNMLTELVKVAEGNTKIAMVGPLMYCTAPHNYLFAAGSFILWKKGSLNHRGLFQPANDHIYLKRPEPVDFIVGCCVLVRSRVIKSIGYLNQDYYLNFEDVEWGLMSHRFGYEVWFVPQAVMWHKVSATLGLASPTNTYYMTRNALLFFWKNASSLERWISLINIISRTIRTIIAWTIKRKYQTHDYKKKRAANFLAIRDFLTGRFGKMGIDVARAIQKYD